MEELIVTFEIYQRQVTHEPLHCIYIDFIFEFFALFWGPIPHQNYVSMFINQQVESIESFSPLSSGYQRHQQVILNLQTILIVSQSTNFLFFQIYELIQLKRMRELKYTTCSLKQLKCCECFEKSQPLEILQTCIHEKA